MTDKIDDGGPAFPRTYNERDYDAAFIPGGDSGMSLRQWYAGMALAGTWTGRFPDDLGAQGNIDRVAAAAFKIADAMIEQSKK